MKYTEEKQSAIIAWYRYNRQTKTQTVYMLFHQRPKSKFHDIKPLTFENKKKNFFFEVNFSSSFENLLPCSERRWFQLKGIKNWTKQVGKQTILFRYVCNFSLCTHSGKQQYRESCNVRLTAATHIRTYTINNTHTSSTDSKHNILQFDLAKKG